MRGTMILAPIVALAGLAACQGILGPDPLPTAELLLEVRESHGPWDVDTGTDPVITLRVETTRIFGCMNYRLLSDLSVDRSRVAFEALGIDSAGACLTAIGPATARHVLEIGTGTRNLLLSSDGGTSAFLLDVTAERIEVTRIAGTTADPKIERFLRFPPQSFAYACRAGSHAGICEDFLARLEATPGVHPYTFPPEGEIPFHEARYGFYQLIRYFRYDATTDFDAVQGALVDFVGGRSLHDQGAYLIVRNWRNTATRSWLLGG